VVADLRVLVADDHDIVRRGVRVLIENRPGWQICGEARDGREAVEKTRGLKPDVVILDLNMPCLNGLEAAHQILRHNPEQKILVLTVADSEQVIYELLRMGVKGYLLKSDAVTELVAAVEALQRNRIFFNAGIERMVMDGFLKGKHASSRETSGPCKLTSREREILQLLAEGRTTKEVAVTLNMSLKTAETHRSNIMRKLAVHSIGELVLYAVRNNVVQVPGAQATGLRGLAICAG
jgi:DNA-binding NarL/FixJ family response regulator